MLGVIVDIIDNEKGRIKVKDTEKKHNFTFKDVLLFDKTNLKDKEVEFELGKNGVAINIRNPGEPIKTPENPNTRPHSKQRQPHQSNRYDSNSRFGGNSRDVFAKAKRLEYILPSDAKKYIETHSLKDVNHLLAQNRLFYYNKRGRVTPLLHFLSQENAVKQSPLLKSIDKRNTSVATELFKSSETLMYKPYSAIIIGTGVASPSDNVPLMTMHHTYGIPYIPGSALKGVVRAYIIHRRFNSSEALALKDDEFKLIFGTSGDDAKKIPAEIGRVVFMDVFPTEYEIYYEAFTPHYSKYYKNAFKTRTDTTPFANPEDCEEPKPLSFPAVKGKFRIIFGTTNSSSFTNMPELKQDVIDAIDWIGFGAKTASGFGVGQATRKTNY